MEKKDIVIALVEKYANGKNVQFAKLLGVSPQTISAWITRNTLDYDLVYTKCRGISPEWLLTGEGDMMLKEREAEQKKDSARRIPLFDDAQTIGGYNDIVANVDDASRVAEYIDAGDWFPAATSAIHHYGDSMVEYPSGSILALKRVDDPRLLVNGEHYVIETSEFRITKQIVDKGEYIMAYSTNKETYPDGELIHAPIRIPKEEIRHMDLVLGCVIKRVSNGPIKIK